MNPLKEPEVRARVTAALPDWGLEDRWRRLKAQCEPVFSPWGLALALVLAASLAVSGLLQFLTGAYEAMPGLSFASSLLNAGLALAVGLHVLMRRPWERAHTVVVLGACLVLAVSLGSLGAKLQYQRGLVGNPFYSLPHQAMRYPATALPVSLQTSDGVRLAGTMLSGGHKRAVILYPSWRTNQDAFSLATLAQWLGNTYDVLVLDPRGQGRSGGAKTPDGDEKLDLVAAAAYLRGNGHDKVAVLAEEDGAYAAILAGGMQVGIDSLALSAPSASWGESLGQTGRMWDPHSLLGRLYWRTVAGLRLAGGPEGPTPNEAVKLVAPTPVLLLGNKSELGSTVDQLHLNAGEPKSLIVLGGSGKPTDWAHFADYYGAVKQWFDFSLDSTEK